MALRLRPGRDEAGKIRAMSVEVVMIKNIIFDIGNVLAAFRWQKLLRSLDFAGMSLIGWRTPQFWDPGAGV